MLRKKYDPTPSGVAKLTDDIIEEILHFKMVEGTQSCRRSTRISSQLITHVKRKFPKIKISDVRYWTSKNEWISEVNGRPPGDKGQALYRKVLLKIEATKPSSKAKPSSNAKPTTSIRTGSTLYNAVTQRNRKRKIQTYKAKRGNYKGPGKTEKTFSMLEAALKKLESSTTTATTSNAADDAGPSMEIPDNNVGTSSENVIPTKAPTPPASIPESEGQPNVSSAGRFPRPNTEPLLPLTIDIMSPSREMNRTAGQSSQVPSITLSQLSLPCVSASTDCQDLEANLNFNELLTNWLGSSPVNSSNNCRIPLQPTMPPSSNLLAQVNLQASTSSAFASTSNDTAIPSSLWNGLVPPPPQFMTNRSTPSLMNPSGPAPTIFTTNANGFTPSQCMRNHAEGFTPSQFRMNNPGPSQFRMNNFGPVPTPPPQFRMNHFGPFPPPPPSINFDFNNTGMNPPPGPIPGRNALSPIPSVSSRASSHHTWEQPNFSRKSLRHQEYRTMRENATHQLQNDCDLMKSILYLRYDLLERNEPKYLKPLNEIADIYQDDSKKILSA